MQNDKVEYQNVEFIDSKGISSIRTIRCPLPPSYRIPIMNVKISTRMPYEDIEPTYLESETYHLHTVLGTHEPQYVEDSWYDRARARQIEARKLSDHRSTESRLDRIEKLLLKIIHAKPDEQLE